VTQLQNRSQTEALSRLCTVVVMVQMIAMNLIEIY